jgi:hypothetical protein
MIRRFLYDQLYPRSNVLGSEAELTACPTFHSRVFVHHAATATYYAPSDISGVGGMRRELIRAVPSWRHGAPRNDCVFIEKDLSIGGFRGLYVAHVLHFLSFHFRRVTYPCALVQWFLPTDDEPCPDTGLWIVAPEMDQRGNRVTSIVHLDCVLRGAHLMGVCSAQFLPRDFVYSDTLHAFQSYFVNKFIDHHSHEIAF